MAFLISLMVSGEGADFRPSRTVGNDAIPWTLATEPLEKPRLGEHHFVGTFRSWVVIGT